MDFRVDAPGLGGTVHRSSIESTTTAPLGGCILCGVGPEAQLRPWPACANVTRGRAEATQEWPGWTQG